MSKNIIMQVLTSAGYEPMYPFSPRQVINANFLNTGFMLFLPYFSEFPKFEYCPGGGQWVPL